MPQANESLGEVPAEVNAVESFSLPAAPHGVPNIAAPAQPAQVSLAPPPLACCRYTLCRCVGRGSSTGEWLVEQSACAPLPDWQAAETDEERELRLLEASMS